MMPHIRPRRAGPAAGARRARQCTARRCAAFGRALAVGTAQFLAQPAGDLRRRLVVGRNTIGRLVIQEGQPAVPGVISMPCVAFFMGLILTAETRGDNQLPSFIGYSYT